MTRLLLACCLVKSLRRGCLLGTRLGNTSAWLRFQTARHFSVKVRKATCELQPLLLNSSTVSGVSFFLFFFGSVFKLRYARERDTNPHRQRSGFSSAMTLHKLTDTQTTKRRAPSKVTRVTPISGLDPAHKKLLIFIKK